MSPFPDEPDDFLVQRIEVLLLLSLKQAKSPYAHLGRKDTAQWRHQWHRIMATLVVARWLARVGAVSHIRRGLVKTARSLVDAAGQKAGEIHRRYQQKQVQTLKTRGTPNPTSETHRQIGHT